MKRKLLAIVNFLLIFFIIFSLIFCPHQEQNLVEIPNIPSITQEVSENINGSTGVPIEKIIKNHDGDLVFAKEIRIVTGSIVIVLLLIANYLLLEKSKGKREDDKFSKSRKITIAILEIIAILLIIYFISFCYRIRKNYSIESNSILNTEDVIHIEKVEPPTVNIIGNYDENCKIYIGNVRIEIIPNKNGDRILYKLDNGEYQEFIPGQIIEITDEEFIYVYSEDKSGNKSDVIEKFIKTEDDHLENENIQNDLITHFENNISENNNSENNNSENNNSENNDSENNNSGDNNPGNNNSENSNPEDNNSGNNNPENNNPDNNENSNPKTNIENAQINIEEENITYTGVEQKPTVSIVIEGKELVEGTDFEVEYKDNINAGTATAVIIGKGDYEGALEKTFEIQKAVLVATYVCEEIICGETPILDVMVQGFVNEESPYTIEGFVFPVVTPTSLSVGEYELTPEGGATSNNYIFKYVSGILKINPKQINEENTTITLSQEEVVYTGEEQKPTVTVVYEEQQLVEGTDFEVEYKDNVDSGTATVIIKGKGDYEGTLEKTFEIEKLELIATYEGEEICYGETPNLIIRVEGFVNNENEQTAKDYVAPTIEYQTKPVGTHELTPEKGSARNYTFKYVPGTLVVNIKKITLDDTNITIDDDNIRYDGTEKTPPIKIVIDGKELVEGEDFDIEYKDNVEPGTATVVIIGKDEYEGTIETTFEIKKAELVATYEGEEIYYGATPKLEVKVEGFVNGDTPATVVGYIAPTLVNNNYVLGEYELTPEGGMIEDPHYEFKYVSGILKIKPKELSSEDIDVILTNSELTYTGTELENEISVVDNGTLLIEGIDYKVEYEDNIDAGTATIKITGIGNYSGEITKTFEIVKAELFATYEGETIVFGNEPKFPIKVEGFVNGETIETAKGYIAPTVTNTNTKAGSYELYPSNGDAKNYKFTYFPGFLNILPKQITEENSIITIDDDQIKYDGTEKTPPVKLVVDGKELVQGEDFDVEYRENIEPGTATVVIIGKGDYEGSLQTTFEIQKADLIVTYEGETIELGQTPSLLLKIEGFVNGDTEATASGYIAPTITNTNTELGSYELTPEGGAADKYNFKYVSGTLVIEPIRLTSGNTSITINETDIKYDGEEQTPSITVVYDGKTLVEGEDFTVEYKDNVNAGEATIVITGKGDYQSQVETKFEIQKLELTVTYLGETIKYGELPKFPLKVAGFIEGENIENAIGYVSPIIVNPNAPVGTHTLTPEGGAATNYNFNYVSGILTVEIKKLSLEDAIISVPEVRYNGSEQTPTLSIEIDGRTLIEGVDFTAEYTNNIEPGTANVTITGIGNYEGTIETTFEIKKAILTVTYPGERIEFGQTPSLNLVISGFINTDAPDCAEGYVAPTISNTNTEIGTYELTPQGGSADKYEFKHVSGILVIEAINLMPENTTITVNETDIKYDGKEQTPSITVVYKGETLVEGEDFTVEYINNVNAGTATIVVTGKGDYQGNLETTFEIQKAILTASYEGEVINYQETPNLNVVLSGFVNGENEKTASGFVMPTITNTNTDVGNYTLTPAGGAADNYNFNYVSGTLVIEAHVAYTVEHYTENLDGTYILSQTENLTGPKNRTITANKLSFTGFEFDSNNKENIESGKILADGSLKLALYYNLIEYSITYELNEGTVNGKNPNYYTVLTEDITLINPSKEYHTFTGWTGTELSSSTTSVVITKGSTENRTYTANWEEYSYTVKFDGNGATSGSMADMANIKYSSVVNLTANGYTRNECNFLGWNTNADGTGTSYADNAEINKLTDVNGEEITLYAQWQDVVAPTWICTNITNTNENYSDYANSDDTVTLTITGTDANYLSDSLDSDKLEVYVGSTIATCNKSLVGPTVIGNGVQYTLTISGIQGNGSLSVKIAENTIKDLWNNENNETTLGTGIIVDNTAPNSPTITMSANGGLYNSNYYYQNSATYTITSGTDNTATLATNEIYAAWGISTLSNEDSIDRTTYTIAGVVTTNETTYTSAVNVAPSSASGNCTITAYTYDKAGNKSAPATVSDNICGNHNKTLNSQKSAATCTAAESRYYRCSDCYITNGTYTGTAALGHNYPCSGSNHKRSGGSVTITCSRCTSTKKYTVTNGTCTYWSCSCGSHGGTSSHASGTYAYADGTYHSYTCSRCSGTVSAKHTHSSWSTPGSSGHYHYCGTCKHTYGSIISHSMGWKTTSSTHGWTCSTCGYTTSSGSHSFTSYSGYKKCDICGYTTGT